MAVHTWDRGGANSAWNRRPCSRRNYPEIFTRLPSPPPPPPRWFFSVGGAYLFSWQAAGKIANFASHLIQGLFIRAYEPCFFRILSSLSLSRISGLTLEILQLEEFEEGELRKRFESLTVLKYIFVCNNRWMKRCYDLKYFFDILRKCERTRRGCIRKRLREKSKKGRNLKLFSKFFSTSDQRFLLDVTLASFFSKLLYEKR